MTQTPSPGRIVLLKVHESEVGINNDALVAPCVVSKVNEDGSINLRVLYDSTEVGWRTSIAYAGDDVTEESADELTWFWPPRV